MSLTDIGKKEAQAMLNSEPDNANVTLDDPNDLQLDQYPTTAIGGRARSLCRCTHSRVGREFIGLTLTDPFVYSDGARLEGTNIFKHSSSDEFSLVNQDDQETHTSDDAVIQPDGEAFRAEKLDRFGEAEGFNPSTDQITVRLTGKPGRYMALCLDDCGLQNTNIVRDSTVVPRLAGNDDPFDGVTLGSIGFNVRLRPELQGETIVLMLQRTESILDEYEGDSYWPTVLLRGSDPTSEYTTVGPNVQSSVGEIIDRG